MMSSSTPAPLAPTDAPLVLGLSKIYDCMRLADDMVFGICYCSNFKVGTRVLATELLRFFWFFKARVLLREYSVGRETFLEI